MNQVMQHACRRRCVANCDILLGYAVFHTRGVVLIAADRTSQSVMATLLLWQHVANDVDVALAIHASLPRSTVMYADEQLTHPRELRKAPCWAPGTTRREGA
jgi:hypothetical protein